MGGRRIHPGVCNLLKEGMETWAPNDAYVSKKFGEFDRGVEPKLYLRMMGEEYSGGSPRPCPPSIISGASPALPTHENETIMARSDEEYQFGDAGIDLVVFDRRFVADGVVKLTLRAT